MSRKLILTPGNFGSINEADRIINSIILVDHEVNFDILHIILSSIVMTGVDTIYSMIDFKQSNSKLINEVVSIDWQEKWYSVFLRVNSVFENYRTPELTNEQLKHIDGLSYLIIDLLFGVETNSSLLESFELKKYYSNKFIPLELAMPMKVLFDAIQTKDATLPIVSLEVKKKDIIRLFDVFKSKEFNNYKEAHSEVDRHSILSDKTIKSIELAGRDLYSKNTKLFDLRENVINAIPFTSKIIDLFFGRLPGVLTEYATGILTSAIKKNEAISIYNDDAIMTEIVNKSLDLYLEMKVPNFKA